MEYVLVAMPTIGVILILLMLYDVLFRAKRRYYEVNNIRNYHAKKER